MHPRVPTQAARVVAMDRERLRSGDRACVRFRFLQRPEYLVCGGGALAGRHGWRGGGRFELGERCSGPYFPPALCTPFC